MKSRRVAVCLITDDFDNILMGKRNSNGKMTNPGGHLEEGEDPFDGARRELKEETNLDAQELDLVDAHIDPVKNLLIYTFQVSIDESKLNEMSGKNDPDNEVEEWKFVDPNDHVDNLHVPLEHNQILKYWIEN